MIKITENLPKTISLFFIFVFLASKRLKKEFYDLEIGTTDNKNAIKIGSQLGVKIAIIVGLTEQCEF